MNPKLSALVNHATIKAKSLGTDLSAQSPLSDEDFAGETIGALSEKSFRRILCQERKRSERSRKNFILMLVRAKSLASQTPSAVLQRVPKVLGKTLRETDTLGWFESHRVVGVIFSELGSADLRVAVKSVQSKTIAALGEAFGASQVNNLDISFHGFPDEQGDDRSRRAFGPTVYPDLFDVDHKKRAFLVMKRVMDVLGSGCALLLLSPVFLVLALLIKLSSKGPVFFRQERLGQFEIPFIFLKFRSMRVSSESDIHREYVRNFIAGKAQPNASQRSHRRVYKITDDPRVTSIGKLMRRTSLDELPQFWNVLMGHMSLVGPRPPIRYELEAYDVWHRRRLWEAKPGITGLWQVHGRSRTTFDEMVRLDLRYSKTWSPLSDAKILLQTPRAVFSGDGAY
jgi:lipopolysaccharide/colanic/teichoic acid biosynthesis glycosyltransferase